MDEFPTMDTAWMLASSADATTGAPAHGRWNLNPPRAIAFAGDGLDQPWRQAPGAFMVLAAVTTILALIVKHTNDFAVAAGASVHARDGQQE